MPPWTCPNTNCVYDKQLEPRQRCPLCGADAEEFSFTALGELWKQKWSLKKSLKKTEEEKRLAKTRKFCPKCGSSDIDFCVFYRPSTWRCHSCGYQGSFILEDGNIPDEISRKRQRRKKKEASE
ncbi:MAG: hypothetical protein ABR962_01310 [Candidatus Bathyarchaeia archaeon]|jgi:predicted RNA-binding Zn-ribbon protein involved in translation (DUF1610 family)